MRPTWRTPGTSVRYAGKGAIRVGVSAKAVGMRQGRTAGCRLVAALLVFLSHALATGVSIAFGGVELTWRTQTPQAGVGATLDVQLFARSTTAVPEAISGLDAIVTWDPASLDLLKAEPSDPSAWLLAGLFNDAAADGLNNTYADGNAYFQALSQFTTPAMATPAGLSVANFRFRALGPSGEAEVHVERTLGGATRSRVFQFGAVNSDILTSLGNVSVKVLAKASLASSEVSLVAGRRAEAWAYGALDGGMTFGATVMLQLVPLPGAAGVVEFTAAPPVDVSQAGDPWPGFGTFTPYDTNAPGVGAKLNGSVDDNGVFVPVMTTYDGALSAFPLEASADAAGDWAVRLATTAGDSHWEGIATSLESGVVRIVDPGDGDGDSFVDLRDFSELQNCFTAAVKPGGGQAFSLEPRRRCGVYDFDDDGDIDGSDVLSLEAALMGSAP